MSKLTFEDLQHNPNGSAKGLVKVGAKNIRHSGPYSEWKSNWNEAKIIWQIVQKNKAEAESWLRIAKEASPQSRHKYENKATELYSQNKILIKIVLRNPIFQ